MSLNVSCGHAWYQLTHGKYAVFRDKSPDVPRSGLRLLALGSQDGRFVRDLANKVLYVDLGQTRNLSHTISHFVLASGYSLMMPFMTISSNKDSVVLSGVKSLSFLPFFPFCLLFFPFFLFLLIFPFLPLSRSTAFNQIYNKFLGTKEIFFLISDKTILLSHLTLSHSFNLSFTHSRHTEQLLFSCLCSKVAVFG